jgi:hypothetical protein
MRRRAKEEHMKKNAVHCVFRNNVLMCLHCGGIFTLKLPMDIDDLGKKTKAFIALHSDCEKEKST